MTTDRSNHDRAAQPADTMRLAILTIALATAMILGGSSVLSPLRLLIILVLAWSAWIALATSPLPRPLPRLALWAGLAILAVPLVQLIPLPLAATAHLPGHDPVERAAAFLGSAGWRPLTLDVEKTLQSFLWAGGCVALFWCSVMLDMRERMWLVRVVLAVALCGLLLGVLQSASTAPDLYLQPDAVPRSFTGFFGNRNHEGDLLVIAFGLALMHVRRGDSRERKLTFLALALVFASGAIATRSRAAVILLLLLAAFTAFQRVRQFRRAIVVVLAASCVLLALVWFTPVGNATIQRFFGVNGSFDRIAIWRESLVPLRQVFALGTGMGTFSELYASIEALENVSDVYLNHAHNDFLQLPIETGIPGVLVFGGVVALCVVRFFQLRREGRRLARGLLGCLAVPLLHSLVDYPLRDFAIGAVVAVIAGFAFAARPVESVTADEGAPLPSPAGVGPRPARMFAGLVMIALAAATGAAGVLVQQDRPALAAAMMPLSADAQLALAQQALGEGGGLSGLREHAARALWLDAYSARAWAYLGYAALRQRDVAKADEAFLSAARLGWRDDLVQDYVFHRAIETGAADTAANAADALLRHRAAQSEAVLKQMAGLVADPRFRAAIVLRMRENPPWNEDFIGALAPLDARQTAAQLDLFARLAASGVEPGSGDAIGYLARADAAGRLNPFLDAWRAAHGPLAGDPAAGPIDSRFGQRNATLFPFGWLIERDRLQQALTLAPGRYELAYRVLPGSGRDGLPQLDVRCSGRRHPLRMADAQPEQQDNSVMVRRSFIIPNMCGVQVLTFPAAARPSVVPGTIGLTRR